MTGKPPPLVPDSLSIATVLRGSAPLAALRQRMDDSQRRLLALRDALPAGLGAELAAGPVDDEGWSLLASNAAVAAKLRQLKPRLEQCLRDRGWQVSAIRIKVQSRVTPR